MVHFVRGSYYCDQKFWDQFIRFINKISNDLTKFYLVTHHNRIKKTIFNDMIEENTNIGFKLLLYKNLFWQILENEIIFKGYPDEDKYIYLEKGDINKNKYRIILNHNDSIITEYLTKIKNESIIIFY